MKNFKTLFRSSKFPCAGEMISTKFIDNFGTRPQKVDVRGSVHRSIIHKENPTNATVYQNFTSYLYEAQHVSGDTPPIIRSLNLH
jgi:hypothetical protein